MTDDERAAYRLAAEANSPFKLHQLVRATRPPTNESVSIDDPDRHFITRVVGWDTLDRVTVGTPTVGGNPHCHSWCWTDSLLAPYDGRDWFAEDYHHAPIRSVGDQVFFMWEEPVWTEQKVGDIIPAVLKCPHIAYRDWIVEYEVPTDKRWITRVVNEMQMWNRGTPNEKNSNA